ncbi:MAG TPA: hypothetical protein VM050_13185 [Patescibacteria group bacterium]|nr:hypothetical protein [Patescibacteria group bacterium]
MSSLMEALYFEFENAPVRIVATRKIPEIETAGITVKETEAGRELMVNLWLAWELIEAGVARLYEEGITDEEWTQIHYRERFQPLGQPTPLPEDFYRKAYLTFKQALKRSSSDRSTDVERLGGRFRDILESRIGKIMRLASAEASAQTKGLQPEEEALYRELNSLIASWRKEIRELGE